MPTPAWSLLIWSGAAAATGAGVLDALLGGRTPAGTLRRLATGVFWLALLPLAYGVVFEAVGRADLVLGGGLGAVHALAGVALRRSPARPGSGRLWRAAIVRLAFGLALGFLYVVPAPP